jgi:hypothetical protein
MNCKGEQKQLCFVYFGFRLISVQQNGINTFGGSTKAFEFPRSRTLKFEPKRKRIKGKYKQMQSFSVMLIDYCKYVKQNFVRIL